MNSTKEAGGLQVGSLSVALVGLNFVFCAIRGPWEEGWYGWTGGFHLKRKKTAEEQKEEQTSNGASKEKSGGEDDPQTDEKVVEKVARKDVC